MTRHKRQRQMGGLCSPAALLLLLALLLRAGAGAIRAQEPVVTSTPDETGAIAIIVQPNDSLWGIAARAGLTLAELLALNNLTESAVIQPGQRLIVGYGTPPATATVPLLPTATLPPPTPRPTVVPPRTAICVAAYDDANRNGLFEPGEPLRPAVAFTIFDETAVVANYVTDGVSEPHCIEGIGGGEYHITRSVAPDEVLTNDGNWMLTLTTGDVARLDFGSYVQLPATETAVAPPPAAGSVPVTRAPAAVTVAAATAAAPSATPAQRNPTAFLAAGFVVMIFVVAVLFLLIWRQLRRPIRPNR